MRLESFVVTDFRSINHSGHVDVADRLTVLVGRNESGKTAILKALHGLKSPADPTGNPAAQAGFTTFTLARDFPRDRPRRDFDERCTVVESSWVLSEDDRKRLGAIWPRSAGATHAVVQRPYSPNRQIDIKGVVGMEALLQEGRQAGEKAQKAVKAVIKTRAEVAESASLAADELVAALMEDRWSPKTAAAVSAVRAAFTPAGEDVPTGVEQALTELERILARFAADDGQAESARKWVDERLPVFVYLDEFDEVPGQHNIKAYLDRKSQGQLQSRDRMFEKLLKVADLNVTELHSLLREGHEERALLTDRASRVFTRRLRTLWKDREIDVQFRVDESHFDVLVKDKDTDALVPLDERSRGFRWYFSFYVTFTADTMGGDKADAVLLLDEPGLFLHATAQAQLLRLFLELPNQIVYTTHSPFMIDPGDLAAVRTVSLEPELGTVVSSDLSGDARTLFPLQAALGYDITQTLFIGTKNVVTEGVTDYWYLTAVADYLRDQGRPSLPTEVVLTPAGGAQKVSYLVSLLASQRLHVVVLLDAEPSSVRTREDLVKARLVRQDSVVMVSDAFPAAAARSEADIEDLLDQDVFLRLAEEAYATELAGRPIPLNPKVPRIVPRLEQAFELLGLEFHKSRVAKRFLDLMGKNPGAALSTDALDRFERLFGALGSAVGKLEARASEPFK